MREINISWVSPGNEGVKEWSVSYPLEMTRLLLGERRACECGYLRAAGTRWEQGMEGAGGVVDKKVIR